VFPSPRVLIQFFQKHKRTLTGVSLDRVALEIGFWEQVVIGMREHLNLSIVGIMSLYEGGWEHEMTFNLGWQILDALPGFILRRTHRNPFDWVGMINNSAQRLTS
jgi:hypothetical protein